MPDEYSFPTTTFHNRSSITLTTSATGEASLALYPSPCFSGVIGNGTISWSGAQSYSGATTAYRAVQQSQLAGQCESFRVVAWGIRVRNLQAPGTATGMLEIAQTPITDSIPNYNVLSTSSILPADLLNLSLGAVATSGKFASLLAYPESDEFAVQELMANDILVSGKVCSSEWLRFLNPDTDTVLGTSFLNEGGLVSSAGAVSGSGLNDVTSAAGRTAILLRLRGFPASINVLDLEYIVHFEGQPSSTSNTTIDLGSAQINMVNPNEVKAVVSRQSLAPVARIIPPWIAHSRGAAAQAIHGGLDAINNRLGLGAASGTIPRRIAAVGGDIGIAYLLKKLKAAQAVNKGAKALTNKQMLRLLK